MSVKPTPEQKAYADNLMAAIRAQVGDRASSPVVGQLVLDIMGRMMGAMEADDSELDPVGAMFALGMACNSLATVLANSSDGRITEAESKTQALNIFSYAMRQQVVAVEVGRDEPTVFKNHGAVRH